jgi:hypothetical protein
VILFLACTFEPGTGFATLAGADVEAALVPGEARDLGGGAVLTDLGYHVAIEELRIDGLVLALEELQGGSVEFDPANPPPGYTLCHGGHCHAEDGSLVDYADVEAELAGDDAEFVPIASLAYAQTFDLLAPEVAHTDEVTPSPELELASVSRASLTPGPLTVVATASEGQLSDDRPFAIEVVPEPFTTGFDLEIDRSAPESFALDAALVVDGTLFDAIDFASVLDDALTAQLVENLAAVSPVIELE